MHDQCTDNCRSYEQPVTELSSNPSTAFIQAQSLVAQWLEKHPGFKLARWRLEPGRGAFAVPGYFRIARSRFFALSRLCA